MPVVRRSATVSQPPARMFDLVADVETYPEFLPWCRSAAVRERGPDGVVATLEISRGPIRRAFTTRNRLHPHERIELELVDGPFRRLAGCWRFDPIGESGCRVSLELDFELAGGVLRRALQPVFSEIANTMVGAFCRRAARLEASEP